LACCIGHASFPFRLDTRAAGDFTQSIDVGLAAISLASLGRIGSTAVSVSAFAFCSVVSDTADSAVPVAAFLLAEALFCPKALELRFCALAGRSSGVSSSLTTGFSVSASDAFSATISAKFAARLWWKTSCSLSPYLGKESTSRQKV
jgi:hypothetical protein